MAVLGCRSPLLVIIIIIIIITLIANVAIANVHYINKDQVQVKRNEAIATGVHT